jgi:hypothetical protein
VSDREHGCWRDSFTGDLSLAETSETTRVLWQSLNEMKDLDGSGQPRRERAGCGGPAVAGRRPLDAGPRGRRTAGVSLPQRMHPEDLRLLARLIAQELRPEPKVATLPVERVVVGDDDRGRGGAGHGTVVRSSGRAHER